MAKIKIVFREQSLSEIVLDAGAARPDVALIGETIHVYDSPQSGRKPIGVFPVEAVAGIVWVDNVSE